MFIPVSRNNSLSFWGEILPLRLAVHSRGRECEKTAVSWLSIKFQLSFLLSQWKVVEELYPKNSSIAFKNLGISMGLVI
jgi:hypothetical protein